MEFNYVFPLLKTWQIQEERYSSNIDKTIIQDTKSFGHVSRLSRSLNAMQVDMYNLTLKKSAQAVITGGYIYSVNVTPTLGAIVYEPSTIKVTVKKKGVIFPNSLVYLLDMNMICIDKAVTDSEGIAYFFNKPSTHSYHVLSEDSSGEYVSTVVSRMKGVVE